MENEEILKHVDHTLLKTTATWEEIRALCDEGIKYGTAGVCIPPSRVRRAKEYVGEELKICTVIGFPNGYATTAAKLFEARDAIENGADEIDMVIDVGAAKEGDFALVEGEVRALAGLCREKGKVLKVIVEACLLTEAEKIKLCEIVTAAGADYIKTSTGFSSGGATREDIRLFAAHIGKNVKMKAAGGIRSLKDAEDFLALGCDRLGTSAVVKLVEAGEKA